MSNWILFKLYLAWQNLTFNKQRFIVAVSAVAFAVTLMFVQVGFRNSYLDTNFEYINRFNADLILVNSQRYVSFADTTFKKNRLYLVEKFPEVKVAYPLYIHIANWRNKGETREYPMRLLGYNISKSILLISGIKKYTNTLKLADTVIVDRKFRSPFGQLQKGDVAEIINRKVKVVGTFELGRVTFADGNLITSYQNFLRIIANKPVGISGKIRTLDDIDIGLLQVNTGVNIDKFAKEINKNLPGDIRIFTKQQFINRDRIYLESSTGIGFIFFLGTIVGFVVGIIVIYNIIYSDILDNLPQYATLKAMGYSNSSLLYVVMAESLILSIFGFFPGFGFSILIYNRIENAIGLLMKINLNSTLLVFSLTIIMSLISGYIASRKLHKVDPVDIYE